MTFYLKPPPGTLHLSGLEQIATKRLEFLLAVYSCQGHTVAMRDLVGSASVADGADCLLEGSFQDLVSHFFLRLVCCQDAEMCNFLVKSETYLFTFRFSGMTVEELQQCVKPLRRFQKLLRKTLGDDDTDNDRKICAAPRKVSLILDALVQGRDWSSLLNQYVTGSMSRSESGIIHIPFEYVLDLVARRSVVLHAGIAHVPCNKLCDIMTSLFALLLHRGMFLAKKQAAQAGADTRIGTLCKQLQRRFGRLYHPDARYGHVSVGLQAEDVARLAVRFPPCMSHLQHQLDITHRLRHFSRIQYTLFLKEVGLPVHEALSFWREEYSKPGDKSRPERTWAQDGRRYTYSIRHLYGLEGSRINYRGHCCSSIQERALGAGEEGGCPFKHFDTKHLLHLLQRLHPGNHSTSDVLGLVQAEQYSSACALFCRTAVQDQRKSNSKSPKESKLCKHKTLAGLKTKTLSSITSKPVLQDFLTGETTSSGSIKVQRKCSSQIAQDVHTPMRPDCFNGSCQSCEKSEILGKLRKEKLSQSLRASHLPPSSYHRKRRWSKSVSADNTKCDSTNSMDTNTSGRQDYSNIEEFKRYPDYQQLKDRLLDVEQPDVSNNADPEEEPIAASQLCPSLTQCDGCYGHDSCPPSQATAVVDVEDYLPKVCIHKPLDYYVVMMHANKSIKKL